MLYNFIIKISFIINVIKIIFSLVIKLIKFILERCFILLYVLFSILLIKKFLEIGILNIFNVNF